MKPTKLYTYVKALIILLWLLEIMYEGLCFQTIELLRRNESINLLKITPELIKIRCFDGLYVDLKPMRKYSIVHIKNAKYNI
jgi:hypothetical protein